MVRRGEVSLQIGRDQSWEIQLAITGFIKTPIAQTKVDSGRARRVTGWGNLSLGVNGHQSLGSNLLQAVCPMAAGTGCTWIR